MCREEEREAIEGGITETKAILQAEDIVLIKDFNLVSFTGHLGHCVWC